MSLMKKKCRAVKKRKLENVIIQSPEAQIHVIGCSEISDSNLGGNVFTASPPSITVYPINVDIEHNLDCDRVINGSLFEHDYTANIDDNSSKQYNNKKVEVKKLSDDVAVTISKIKVCDFKFCVIIFNGLISVYFLPKRFCSLKLVLC